MGREFGHGMRRLMVGVRWRVEGIGIIGFDNITGEKQ
jgi:hypothetical protein